MKNILDNIGWYAGVALFKFVIGSGRKPTVMQWLVAAHVSALEHNISHKEMVDMLAQAQNYDPEEHRDNEKTMKSLGF